MLMDLTSHHDYAGCIYFNFCNKIQLEYYGSNMFFFKEGIDLDQFECELKKKSKNLSGLDILDNFIISFMKTAINMAQL